MNCVRSTHSIARKIETFVLVPLFVLCIFQLFISVFTSTPFTFTEEKDVIFEQYTLANSSIGVNVANTYDNQSDALQNALISIVSSNETWTSSNQTTKEQTKRYDPIEYKIQFEESIKPLRNISTCVFMHRFYGGFCNQYLMFTSVMIMVEATNHSQILLHPLKWKDTMGTYELYAHSLFFDVVHWNTYYPRLPRLVTYDETLHPDVIVHYMDTEKPKSYWNITFPYKNATKPYAIGHKKSTVAWANYRRYSRKIESGKINRSDAELLMIREAFKPHPSIQQIIDDFKSLHQMKNIMVWHARIEPDMQKHPVCKDYKVTNISDILDMIYEKYEEPPVSTVLIALDRSLLEEEVSDPSKTNELALHNLHVLNEIMSKGMWGGRVKVLEAGSQLAKHSGSKFLTKVSTLVGSIINFFLFLEADIFIGTKVSSWSHYVMMYRFFREKKMNYFYQPKGLDWVTPPLVDHPPRFIC